MIIIFYNQVYMPSISDNAKDLREWVKAKMWFNMVDAQYHESITHLGKYHFTFKWKIMQIFSLENHSKSIYNS